MGRNSLCIHPIHRCSQVHLQAPTDEWDDGPKCQRQFRHLTPCFGTGSIHLRRQVVSSQKRRETMSSQLLVRSGDFGNFSAILFNRFCPQIIQIFKVLSSKRRSSVPMTDSLSRFSSEQALHRATKQLSWD